MLRGTLCCTLVGMAASVLPLGGRTFRTGARCAAPCCAAGARANAHSSEDDFDEDGDRTSARRAARLAGAQQEPSSFRTLFDGILQEEGDEAERAEEAEMAAFMEELSADDDFFEARPPSRSAAAPSRWQTLYERRLKTSKRMPSAANASTM